MATVGRRIVQGAVALLLAGVMAGCATSRKVTLLYQPVVHDGKGAGTLHLAAAPEASNRADIQWVLGTVKNDDGESVGDIVSPIAPVDLVTDALRQELSSAGYTVSTDGSLPPGAAKGVVVTGVEIHLGDVASLVKEEGSSRVKISLELWKNGEKTRKFTYESSFSDFAVKDRDQLLPTILQKALQGAMERAVPEIITVLGH